MNILGLRDAIKRRNLSIVQVAELMSVDQSTIHRKLNSNGEAFTIGEIKRLIEILQLSAMEISNIFPGKEREPMRTKGRLPNPPGCGDNKGMDTKIYLDAECAEKLRELSYQTRLPMAEITRKIMAEALSRVELVPATVYDFKIK